MAEENQVTPTAQAYRVAAEREIRRGRSHNARLMTYAATVLENYAKTLLALERDNVLEIEQLRAQVAALTQENER